MIHFRIAKREITMNFSSDLRQTAVSFAAAFVTAMLFVASAVGPAAHVTFA